MCPRPQGPGISSPVPPGCGAQPCDDHLVAQTVKNLPAMQETRVRSPGWEDPLEKGMATHSSILVWRIPQTEKPGGLQFMGFQRVDVTERLTHWKGEGVATAIAASFN